jgi:zinc protease
LLGTLCLPLAAFAADVQPTHEFILDNGLKVVVREGPSRPVVVSQIWYKSAPATRPRARPVCPTRWNT